MTCRKLVSRFIGGNGAPPQSSEELAQALKFDFCKRLLSPVHRVDTGSGLRVFHPFSVPCRNEPQLLRHRDDKTTHDKEFFDRGER